MDNELIAEIENFIKSDNSDDISEFKKKLKKLVTSKKEVLSPNKKASKLKNSLSEYNREVEFSEGDLITWKEGLKNKRFPKLGEPAIVVEVLDEPIINEEENPSTPYFREVLDIKIGVLEDEGNNLLIIHSDHRRYEHY